MPNFGDARNTLAKEASWEPEEPEESEDERKLPIPHKKKAEHQDVIDYFSNASPTSYNFNADYEDVLQLSESLECMLNWISQARSSDDSKLAHEDHCAGAPYLLSTKNVYSSTAGRLHYKLSRKLIQLDDNGKPRSKVSGGLHRLLSASKLRLGVC